MTRTASGVLSEQLSDLRERQAVTETKIDALNTRTLATEKTMASMAEKLDRLISGQSEIVSNQAANRTEIKAEIAAMKTAIDSMHPDWKSVQHIKAGWKYLIWIAGIVGAIAGALAYSKAWMIMNINYLFGK